MIVVLLLTILIASCLDRLSKSFFLTNTYSSCLKILCLKFSFNKGWPLLSINQLLINFLSGIFLILLLFILIKGLRRNNYCFTLGIGLLIIGGASNLFDRLYYGGVIDFISLSFWPFSSFNLADILIFFGLLLLSVSINKNSLIDLIKNSFH